MTPMEYPKRAGSDEEFLVCTELLPAIRERYGPTFALLEIPEVLRSNRGDGTIYFRHYGDKRYNDRWNEQDGGSHLGIELSSEMVEIIKEIHPIDVDWVLSQHPVGKTVRESAFDLQRWLLSFQQQRTQAVGLGISSNEFEQAEEFIKSGFQLTRRIFSNGDFYPRNLIKSANDKMVLVDWGYWTGHRACFVDYLVNVAAFAFIHMWGNSLWQKEFVRHLREAALDIELDDLRKAVLIKSFEQALFFQGCAPQFAPHQVNHFRMALANEIFY